MQHTPAWQAADDSATRPPDGRDAADLFGYDRLLQRRAMLAMAAAMGAMLCGLPLHLLALGGTAHRAVGAAGWLSAALATLAIVAVLPALRRSGCVTPALGRAEQAVVLCCAAAAYLVSWIGLLGGLHTLLYFDVAAMSVAAVAEGRALDVGGRRQAVAAAEQLVLLTNSRCPAPPVVVRRSMAWLPASLIVVGIAATVARTAQAGDVLVLAMALAAACCPCAVGVARASAYAVARELALRDGWIVASGLALAAHEPWRSALGLPTADRERLARLGRAAQRAARLNVAWSVLLPALLLPLALRGPVDPLLPAAAMVIAWAAIGLTNRLLIGRHAVT